MMSNIFKSGFAVLIGRPNVGKSSLLNAFIGQKIVITSEKPQTTRNQVRGITTGPNYQIIWIDTPGLHQPLHRLGKRMIRTAHEAFSGADLLLWVLDASQGLTGSDLEVAETIKNIGELTVFIVWNKTDLKPAERLAEIPGFDTVYLVSAVTGKGLPELQAAVVAALPEGPQYYPAEMVTDHPELFCIAEFIREQVLNHTMEEIPHSVAVRIERMEERPNGLKFIEAVIYVERESQKGIIIGAKGTLLKKIGSAARKEIEELLETPVFLNLWVKVSKKWRNNETALKEFGYGEEE